ncbi:hypothetical protein OG21DRAFT_1488269 [Imleria badia]|nr:hypothetical protein OG21DRAFT_1488269 [Imleria badia]
MLAAAKWVSVYNEPYRHTREATRARILDAWLVPLCAIFQGRLINKPENRPPPAQFMKGGEVEVEVEVMSGGRNEVFLLLVVEMKLSELNEDNVAQVLLELSSGYQLNLEQMISQPVYALLTDLKSYYFFSFDGTRFTRSAAGNIRINRTHKEFFVDMAEVSERLFGALLKGYISFLQQVAAKSKVRGELGDLGNASSASKVRVPAKQVRATTIRKSLDLWDDAIKKAEHAKELLETKNRTRDSAERDGCEGLSLLRESALNLPEPSFYFSADLGEGLKGEVDSALAEIFPAVG